MIIRQAIDLACEWRDALRTRFREKAQQRPPSDPGFLGVISTDPLVIYHLGCKPAALLALHDALGDRDAWIIRGVDWVEQRPGRTGRWATHIRRMEKLWPRHRYILAGNTESSAARYREAGVRAEFIHHNALLDERLFKVDDRAEKKFDAVYIARLVGWKRIELAAEVKNLALVTYSVEEGSALVIRLRELIDGDAWLNYATGAYQRLSPDEVARICRASRVGLMLSAAEGGNYASVEYFLSGLPLVTTPSIGGRSEFYDDRFVRIVKCDASAVARATEEFVDLAPDPQMIRSATIERMELHRETLRSVLDEICVESGAGTTGREIWDQNFFSKLCTWRSVTNLMEQIDRGVAGDPKRSSASSKSSST